MNNVVEVLVCHYLIVVNGHTVNLCNLYFIFIYTLLMIYKLSVTLPAQSQLLLAELQETLLSSEIIQLVRQLLLVAKMKVPAFVVVMLNQRKHLKVLLKEKLKYLFYISIQILNT